jgi:hypothetical protein
MQCAEVTAGSAAERCMWSNLFMVSQDDSRCSGSTASSTLSGISRHHLLVGCAHCQEQSSSVAAMVLCAVVCVVQAHVISKPGVWVPDCLHSVCCSARQHRCTEQQGRNVLLILHIAGYALCCSIALVSRFLRFEVTLTGRVHSWPLCCCYLYVMRSNSGCSLADACL